MEKQLRLLYFILVILFFSCKNDNAYIYTIKDFRKPLQAHLNKIVLRGVVPYADSSLKYMATDDELRQLSLSEHPVLRVSALIEMQRRKSFNHFDVLMNHLDDTAIVAISAREFGVYYRKVSDFVLEKSIWQSDEEKNKTIEKVITKHNYLKSAYTILFEIEPQEKYYPFIKDMATRIMVSDNEIDGNKFGYLEYALYGLAKFKKEDDIEVIQKQLLKNYQQLGSISFRLMKEFPDTSYLQVFEKYYSDRFYSSLYNNQDENDTEVFINSLATYKNKRSAKILNSILTKKNIIRQFPDTVSLKQIVAYAVWDNECVEYSKLRKSIEPIIRKYEKYRLEIAAEPFVFSFDSSERKIIHW